MEKSLSEMNTGEAGTVSALEGGQQFILRLQSRGVRKGEKISVLTRQPRGPLVVEAGRTQLTIGRGMAEKIKVHTEE
ncbi:MAG: FeoA family protein [bacterium]